MKRLCAALALAGLMSCGGGSPSAPSQFSQQLTGNVGVFGTTEHSFSATRAGTMTIVLRWTTATDLDLYLTNSACQINDPRNCVILASATGTTGNQETVTRTVTNGESFKFVVDNNSETLASPYTLDVTIR